MSEAKQKDPMWILSRVFFTLIVNLSAIGCYTCYQWYEAQKVQQLDVTELETDTLSDLQKQVNSELKYRLSK